MVCEYGPWFHAIFKGNYMFIQETNDTGEDFVNQY